MQQDLRLESLTLAVGQGRVISHGLLLFLIVAAAFYLAVSARSMVTAPALSWSSETTRSFNSDGYLLHPNAAVPTTEASVARADGMVLQLSQGARAGATSAEAGPAQPAPAEAQASVAQAGASSPAPEQRGPIQYEVEPGDTVSTIAESFGISTETVLWANNLSNADFVKIGQTLLIPPTSGVVHTVVKGDTLLSIALRYGSDTETIAGYPANEVSDPDSLSIGQQLVIPGGRIPAARAAASSSTRGGTRAADAASAAPAQAAAPPSGHFIWPNPGKITQYFSGSHDAIDIATPIGTPIVAADGGVVVDQQQLGWGLGWYITVDHGNGYSTTYAHMGSFAVGPGERVSQGQMIGRVGMTGLTTGPHNHFIVRRNGVPVNPLGVLP